MERIIIRVKGGVVEVASIPDNTELLVLDFDIEGQEGPFSVDPETGESCTARLYTTNLKDSVASLNEAKGRYEPMINWFLEDHNRIKRLQQALKKAVADNTETFVFPMPGNDKNEFVTGYAKYLLEYLNSRTN